MGAPPVIRAAPPGEERAMTAVHLAPALAAADLDAAIAALRAHGLRVSAARRLVLEALFAAEVPLSAEAIAAGLDGRLPRSELASVYRNLETLEAIGIVRHIHLGHGPGRYELAGRHDGWTTCEACGRSTPLPSPALHAIRLAAREAAGFEPSFTHFALVGRCRDCRGT